jgi:hypothetical protein
MLKKVFFWMVLPVLVVSLVVYVVSGIKGGSQEQPRKSITTSKPTNTTPGSAPTPTTPAGPDESPLPADNSADGDLQLAITSAALATDALWQAQLQTGDDLSKTIDHYVVAEGREDRIKFYTQYNPVWANHYGYVDLAEATDNAYPYVNTLQYKVVSFGNGDLQVMLYQDTHWFSLVIKGEDILRQEWLVPGVSVIQMRREDGRWMFVKASDPPPELNPSLEGLKRPEMVAKFVQPLKEGGFKPYVAVKAGP